MPTSPNELTSVEPLFRELTGHLVTHAKEIEGPTKSDFGHWWGDTYFREIGAGFWAEPDVVALMDTVLENTAIRRHLEQLTGLDHVDTTQLQVRLAEPFLDAYSQRVNFWALRPRTFRSIWEQLVRTVAAPWIEVAVTAVLRGFESEVTRIGLENDANIRKVPERSRVELVEEVWDYWGRWRQEGPRADDWRYPGAVFLIETAARVPKSPVAGRRRALLTSVEACRAVVTALRLFKAGFLPDPLYRVAPTGIFRQRFGPRVVSTLGSAMAPRAAYTLSSKEARRFRGFWKAVGKNIRHSPEPLGVAIRRFNLAYERGSDEDRLIDQMIAFEALFLRERVELGYRLRLRVAAFLGGGAAARQVTAQEVKTAYDLRSRVVHGDPVGADEVRIAADNMEGYLRACLTKLVRNPPGGAWGEWLTHLDGLVVR